jgi:hypothetical protein
MQLLLLAKGSRFAICPAVCIAVCLAVGYLLAAGEHANGGESSPYLSHTFSSPRIKPQDLELEVALTHLFNQPHPSKSARDRGNKTLIWGARKRRQEARSELQFGAPSRSASQGPTSDLSISESEMTVLPSESFANDSVRMRKQDVGQEILEESAQDPEPEELAGPVLMLPASIAKAPIRQPASLKAQTSSRSKPNQAVSRDREGAGAPKPVTASDRAVASQQGSERPVAEPLERTGTVARGSGSESANQGTPDARSRLGATNPLGKALSRPNKMAAQRAKTSNKRDSKPDSTSALPSLTRQQQQLRGKIRRVLSYYYNRPMNVLDHSPWEVMHMALAFEVHSKVLQGGPQSEPITAIGWLCFNQPCKRRALMYVNRDGQVRVRVGPALQGHHGQLLAILAQSSVKSDYPLQIDEQDMTVADLIEMEKETCYPRTELTFKLISLMHYLPSDATWTNDQGMEWDIPQLIREELRQPIRGAACGGTHRLAGLTLAYKKRRKRREPVDGEYLKAERFVRNYQRYAYRLQNSDGSFSTEWFRGRGAEQDIERRLKTTGHTLEWLLYTATERELRSRQTIRAVNYLANLLLGNRQHDWDAGQLSHAIHALLLYDRLAFGKYDQWKSAPIARKRSRTRG